MNIETLAIVILVFIIVGALVAIETPDLLSAVICLGTVDIGFTILFLFLKAPDIAITQMVVEVVCLVILIRATIRRDMTLVTGERQFFGLMVMLAILGILALALVRIVPNFGAFGDPIFARAAQAPSQRYLAGALKDTGAANAVAAVILDYRGYDTLGEATILFAAVVGAVALLRPKPRKRPEERDA